MTLEARVIGQFAAIERDEWERLERYDNPFLSHSFLSALESSGSVNEGGGWTPSHLALFEEGRLVAFAPTYVKGNSHGEFVFDWGWADAYRRHGLTYYPKLLTGVPYSPVTGPRLLVRAGHPGPDGLRSRLVDLALATCARQELSSWHCNFIHASDLRALGRDGLLSRFDWQFHWRNRGYASFDDFLARLKSRKRKSIRRERRQVAAAGIRFRWHSGRELSDTQLDFVYRCYVRTFEHYGNHPALTPTFFEQLAAGPDGGFLVAIASGAGEPLAMSLFLAGGGRLYGRYWGCTTEVPGLHFEAAYYQGIEYCIRNGVEVFESGAQGEHKIGRGFLPARTRSVHYLREPAFHDAVGHYLERERGWMEEYSGQLARLDPYRQEQS